ncbi:hypothetical protein [Polaribacter sp. SA4-12]|uniref:hypothetical protein n=1 Tax=Polaribacter sp. SA4-12 TaxID=1312072 RepID=UPI000B3C3AB2|nr:hypothetical protein [Polaribacter sp. SA4-12]ARV15440.1 hypothetical protein BTO07_09945 [Polaribacter sp. SA4-12]
MELKEIFKIIIILGNITLALNTFLFFKDYRKKTVAFKIIAFYLLYVLIIQLRMSYLSSLHLNNLHYTHFYFIGQLVLLSFFFILEFKNKLLSNIIKIYLFIASLSLGLCYFLFPELINKHNMFEVVITSIPLTIYSFIFLVRRIDSDNKKFIYLNSGLFVYITCSTLIFVAGSFKSDIKIFIWFFNASLYLIYQILVFVDWYKNFRKLN